MVSHCIGDASLHAMNKDTICLIALHSAVEMETVRVGASSSFRRKTKTYRSGLQKSNGRPGSRQEIGALLPPFREECIRPDATGQFRGGTYCLHPVYIYRQRKGEKRAIDLCCRGSDWYSFNFVQGGFIILIRRPHCVYLNSIENFEFVDVYVLISITTVT